MIYLARFHSGERIAINPDLIERIEETPDTVITLTSGAKYVVGETMDEVAEKYRAFRATMFTLAISMVEPQETVRGARLHVVRDVSERPRAMAGGTEPESAES